MKTDNTGNSKFKTFFGFFVIGIFSVTSHAEPLFAPQLDAVTEIRHIVGEDPHKFAVLGSGDREFVDWKVEVASLVLRRESGNSANAKVINLVTDGAAVLRFQFDLREVRSQGIGLQVLCGMQFKPDNSNENEANNVLVRFGLVFSEGDGLTFRIRDIDAGKNFNEVLHESAKFTFAINSTTEDKTFTAPDGSETTIASRTASLWVNETLIAPSIAINEKIRDLTDFAFFASGPQGMGNFALSDISIEKL